MTITLNGDTGITTPTYGGAVTAEYTVPVTAFKNRIINGAMMIDQRNAGAQVTNPSGYTLDRWQASSSGGSINVQQVAGTGAYAYDALLTGGSGVTHAYFYQRIENLNCLDLTSKSVTFQAQLSSTTATSVTVSLYVPSTANSFPGSFVSSTTISITSTPTIYSWTVNAGANAANGLQVQIDFGALTSGTARVSGVQLEKGSTATSFDYRPYGTELALCQRYYYRNAQGSGNSVFMVGAISSTTNANRCGMQFPVTMRAEPTVSYGGTGAPRIYDGLAASAITSIPQTASTVNSAAIELQASGGSFTAGRCAMIIDGTAAYFAFSSEL